MEGHWQFMQGALQQADYNNNNTGIIVCIFSCVICYLINNFRALHPVETNPEIAGALTKCYWDKRTAKNNNHWILKQDL